MASNQPNNQYTNMMREVITALVKRRGRDFTIRQFAVYLTRYLQEGDQTVRGVAAQLKISKPAIVRALDVLGKHDFIRRKVDPRDRRSVLLQRTLKGSAFLQDFRTMVAEASGGHESLDKLVEVVYSTVVAFVQKEEPDLSMRQFGVFLICYLTDGAHTVRGLAEQLDIPRPSVTRVLDVLGELDVARRKVDPMDRRSVLVQRTLKGSAFLRDLRKIMQEAADPRKPRGGAGPTKPAPTSGPDTRGHHRGHYHGHEARA